MNLLHIQNLYLLLLVSPMIEHLFLLHFLRCHKLWCNFQLFNWIRLLNLKFLLNCLSFLFYIFLLFISLTLFLIFLYYFSFILLIFLEIILFFFMSNNFLLKLLFLLRGWCFLLPSTVWSTSSRRKLSLLGLSWIRSSFLSYFLLLRLL